MEQKVTGGSVVYDIQGDEVKIQSCQVEKARFEIPTEIAKKPVTEISKKAILSSKILKELVLPDSLFTVGEWAFAHCSNLEKVWMKKSDVRFGRGAFKDCRRLTRIYVREGKNAGRNAENLRMSDQKLVTEKEASEAAANGEMTGQMHADEQIADEKIAGLLALVPVMLEAEYLLTPMEAGEEVWLQKLDARILELLKKPDREGYSKQVLCGEEDLMASMDVYLADRRKQKARLCYLRLLHDMGLSDNMRSLLNEWLKSHAKGCESEAAWEVALKEHGENNAYYELYAAAGGITEENFDALLSDMGEEDPERKAWILRYKKEHMEQTDFFDGFAL